MSLLLNGDTGGGTGGGGDEGRSRADGTAGCSHTLHLSFWRMSKFGANGGLYERAALQVRRGNESGVETSGRPEYCSSMFERFHFFSCIRESNLS
jgi:hypothetical protein